MRTLWILSPVRAAPEKVRAARALVELPQTSASMARGELSFSAVRALTRVATAENKADLLEVARGCTTAQIERMVRSWKRGSRLSDVLYRERKGLAATMEAETVGEAAKRRADARGLLAERAMAAGFGESAESVPISGTRAERYQVVLHVEPETLAAIGSEFENSPRSEFEDGTRVAAETSQRLSCDAGLVRIERARVGSVLNAGRRTRTIPPALRRALDVRDRGPGAGG